MMSPSIGSPLHTVSLQLPSCKYLKLLHSCYQRHIIYSLVTATSKLDVRDVIKYLWPARLMWRQIGIALGIDASTLVVVGDNHRQEDDCFLDVILRWSRNSKHVPCWKVLAEALSSPTVGVIVTRHKTSKGNSNYCLHHLPCISCVCLLITRKDETRSEDDGTVDS